VVNVNSHPFLEIKMKVEILTNNIFLNGKTNYQGEIVTASKEEVDIVKKIDKEAGRDFRLKVIAEKKVTKKATKVKK
jgi:hypothetical protein|tara:strand:- start:576 stop:806 length:231 start_codon:yes stop_codon:yes gene_type:complete